LRSPWSCLMVFPHRFGSMFHAARLQEMGWIWGIHHRNCGDRTLRDFYKGSGVQAVGPKISIKQPAGLKKRDHLDPKAHTLKAQTSSQLFFTGDQRRAQGCCWRRWHIVWCAWMMISEAQILETQYW
jgi:hypothetical protein